MGIASTEKHYLAFSSEIHAEGSNTAPSYVAALKKIDTALHLHGKTVIEVEAGKALTNHQFLKDLFEACMMNEADYLVIAVRNIYATKLSASKDFEKIEQFFDTLYQSERLQLPLSGILLIGY